ncbi:MAG: hypothetical protein ACRBB0_22355 [Pelagimonas sp.]
MGKCSKVTDIGDKLDLGDVAFSDEEHFQPAVIAGEGAVFGMRY